MYNDCYNNILKRLQEKYKQKNIKKYKKNSIM